MLDLTLFEETATNTEAAAGTTQMADATEDPVAENTDDDDFSADEFYRRVKEIKARQHTAEKEIVSLMAKRFGVAKEDYKSIKAAIDEDIAKSEKSDDISQKLELWQKRESEVQKIYPGFVLAKELHNRDFFNLCYNGVDVMTAYQVLHFDDIIMAAMSYAISEMKRAGFNDNTLKYARAREGVLDDSSGKMRQEKPKLTKKERDELIRRAERGETVRL